MATICIRGGLLIDGTGAPPVRDGAVLVRDGRIEKTGPFPGASVSDGTEVLEFPGLTILPGLVDCHSHLNMPGDGSSVEEVAAEGDERLLLRAAGNARRALESGVTTLRENGASHRTAFVVREAIARGIIAGPRLSICGRPVTVSKGHCWMFGGEADGEEGVRRTVRGLVEEGADWIKVMATGGGTLNTDPFQPSYTAAELRAAVEEAHTCGRLAAAHALCTAGIVSALEAGFDMIVHCYFHEPDGRYVFEPEVAKRIAGQGVWVNPTMHMARSRVWRLERTAEQRPLSEVEAAQLERERQSYRERCDGFQGLLAEGVRVVAGSDSGWSHCPFGGFAHEVDAMAGAGLGAEAALAAATLDSARAMGVDREVGSLEEGKLADVLVVEGDPSQDSGALLRVAAVFLGGERV